MTKHSTLDGYVYGVRIGRMWLVRVGAWTGEGETIEKAMRAALLRAVS